MQNKYQCGGGPTPFSLRYFSGYGIQCGEQRNGEQRSGEQRSGEQRGGGQTPLPKKYYESSTDTCTLSGDPINYIDLLYRSDLSRKVVRDLINNCKNNK